MRSGGRAARAGGAGADDPYTIISADAHAGLPCEEYRPYLDLVPQGLEPVTLREGGTPLGNHPQTPWGVPTLGYRTRRKGKQSDRYIVRGRRRGKKGGR